MKQEDEHIGVDWGKGEDQVVVVTTVKREKDGSFRLGEKKILDRETNEWRPIRSDEDDCSRDFEQAQTDFTRS